MKKFGILIILGLTMVILPGCVPTSSYLVKDSKMIYSPTESVEIYLEGEKPDRPYTAIGTVVAEGDYESEESLYEMLKKKAMEKGAHGIIMKSSTTQKGFDWFWGFPVTHHRLEGIAIRFKQD